jgi:hypothetical protein
MKTRGNTWFALNCDQNSCIWVTCDNTYTMKSKYEMYLLTFLSYNTFCHLRLVYYMRLVLGD